jgi:hypothetical protein
MNEPRSTARPYCTVAVVLVPLDEDGRPRPEHTVTLTGIGATRVDPESVEIFWRAQEPLGTKFTISGPGALVL